MITRSILKLFVGRSTALSLKSSTIFLLLALLSTSLFLSKQPVATAAAFLPCLRQSSSSLSLLGKLHQRSALLQSLSRSRPQQDKRHCTRLSISATEAPVALDENSSRNDDDGTDAVIMEALADAAAAKSAATSSSFPELQSDGLYHIVNKEQHANFLRKHVDKIIVLKIYAPWCRACKGLEPKFLQISKSPVYQNLPIVWADLSIASNKAFVQSLGVLALPSIQFYVAAKITDTFACGPSKVPILKRKLAALVNEHVDPKTRQLKEGSADRMMGSNASAAIVTRMSNNPPLVTLNDTMTESAKPTLQNDSVDTSTTISSTLDALRKAAAAAGLPVRPRSVSPVPLSTPSSSLDVMSESEKRILREKVPYLDELSLADLDTVLAKAKLLNFEAGSILMREGRSGRTFYVIRSGEVEICQKIVFDDPLATPTNYLGTVINRLGPWDYFGERALITGEPRAASIRAVEATSVWAFDKDDFPASSPLSSRTRNTLALDIVNDKYGVSWPDLYGSVVARQITQDASTANQIRGSVNSPQLIRGVDTDDDEYLIAFDKDAESVDSARGDVDDDAVSLSSLTGLEKVPAGDAIFDLLNRFQLIRHVKRCFDYIVTTKARWGEEGIRARRSLLVNRLTPAQRAECLETFDLMDVTKDGKITLMELKRVLESVGEVTSDAELQEFIAKGQDEDMKKSESTEVSVNASSNVITKQDFLGIWAEAEFFNLFRDIFSSLDPHDTGFVKARELDRVLCGVRDLVSTTTKTTEALLHRSKSSILDGVEDQDMLIDYEQFSRMLLGSTLL